MERVIDRTGNRYGRLVVLRYAGSDRKWNALWECQCDCGNIKVVKGYDLVNGTTKSCGCLVKDKVSTHRMTNTRLYGIWTGMKGRCKGTCGKSRKYYHDKGITVCEEWANSFEAFYKWSMENGYNDSLTIDRIDPNGNYSPENCRWATYTQQGNNKSNSKRYFHNGEWKTATEWAVEVGINKATFINRLHSGMSFEEAITRPIRKVTRKNKEVLES